MPTQVEIVNAIIAGLIAFVGIQLALFAGEGVIQFSDITPVQYAIAGLTGLSASLKDIQSRRALPK